MNAAVITIGNEILLGRTLNTNLAWLGRELASLGIPLAYSIAIPDDPIEIRKALENTWNCFDVVISTGGLGPTEDDMTKASIAEFFGKELRFDDDVWQHVEGLFSRRGMPTPEINRCQAMVPEDFIALRNDLGTAPGLYYKEQSKLFFALQGVPLEMKHIFTDRIKPIILQTLPNALPVYQSTLHTHGISESRLAELFGWDQLPPGVNLAWLPQTGRVDMRFYGSDANAIKQAICKALPVLKDYVWGYDDDSPASVLLDSLKQRNETISLAESCTGGWTQKLLTDVSGASQCYLGGVVSYANSMKKDILQVPGIILERMGAVSAECAAAMAKGIKRLTKSCNAISVTGIAGPEGGSKEKPVGTVFFGFETRESSWTKKQVFNGERDSIRLKAAEFALLELIKYLQGRMI